jgi:hypothetical protein
MISKLLSNLSNQKTIYPTTAIKLSFDLQKQETIIFDLRKQETVF